MGREMIQNSTLKARQGLGEPRNIRVLQYYRIVDDRDHSRLHWSCTPLGIFRRHLELLERWGYTTITFNDYRLFRSGELNLPRKAVVLTFDGAYLENYTLMFPTLRKFGANAVVFAHGDRNIKEDVWHREAGFPKAPLMNDQHLLELNAAGVEVGSHTMTHPDLTSLAPEKASEEIMRSRILLEILLNAPVLSFAYPFGLMNRRIKHIVAEAGYSIACTIKSGSSIFGKDDLEVRRINMKNEGNALLCGLRLLASR